VNALLRDLRHAARSLRKSPAFTAATVLTLALGLGGNTGLFALVNRIVLQPLPYPEPESLVVFHWNSQGGVAHACPPGKFLFWQQESRAFDHLAAYEIQSSGATLVGGAEPEYVDSLRVSAHFFRTLGVRPSLGRDFLPAEDAPGAAAVAVLSHGLWRRNFGADTSAIGRSLRLGDQTYEIVGVAPAGFEFTPEADLWTPLKAAEDPHARGNLYAMVGRLGPEFSRLEAQREADALFAAYQRESPLADGEEIGVFLGDFKAWLVGDTRRDVLLLFTAGILVFLICCLNLSNLLAARLAAREGEAAVQLALGAGWRRVLKARATEYLLMAFVASVLGWAVARAAVAAVLVLSPYPLPRAEEVQVGLAEALFTSTAALLAVLLVGIVPALRATRADPGSRLRALAGVRGGTVGKSRRRLGRVLVVSEVALSLAVLVAAWDLIGTFLRLRSVDPGFRAENVLTFQVPLQAEKYRSSRATLAFSEELLRRLRELPGVVDAASVTSLPLTTGLNVPAYAEGSAIDQDFEVEYRAVSPDYFRALGIPVRGRGFTVRDGADAAAVAVVNATLARRSWEDDALGRRTWIARGLGELADRPREVVGVAGDVHDLALGSPPRPTVYVPQAQVPDALGAVINGAFPLSWVVRLERPGSVVNDLRRLVREVDSHQAVASVEPLTEVVADSLLRERFYATSLALLAGLALWLTLLGIYGVTSQQVTERTHEIGLRMAVGADRWEVRRMIVGEVAVLSLVGIGLGMPMALALNRLMGSLFAGVGAGLSATFLAAALVVMSIALLAGYLPARIATRVDPLVVLRG
jgi:putative ABC transport system permease protein